MGKRLSMAGAIGVLLAALSVAPAAAAEKEDPFIACLKSDKVVCSTDGASIVKSSDISKALKGKVSVAVVPYDGTGALNPQQLANEYAEDAGVDELILVADRSGADDFGVHSKSDERKEKVLEALNRAKEDNNFKDGGDAIVAANIGSFYDTPVVSDAGDGGAGFPVLAVALPAVAVMAAASVGIALFRSRKRRSETGGSGSKPKVQDFRGVDLSEGLQAEIGWLRATAKRHQSLPQSEFARSSALIEAVLGHIYELFSRIDRKKAKQSRSIAEVRYLDILKKLNGTLGPDYFEDIVLKPALWDDDEAKKQSVITALESVDRQLIENIRQVNSSKEIEFRVAIDSLIGTEGPSVDDAFGDPEGKKDRRIKDGFGI